MKTKICYLIPFLFCIPPAFSQITFTEHTISDDFDDTDYWEKFKQKSNGQIQGLFEVRVNGTELVFS